MIFTLQYLRFAQKIFCEPSELYAYAKIVNGASVSGRTLRMKALGSNTFRGFHRIDKGGGGAQGVFDKFFSDKQTMILDGLKAISSRKQLDDFLHDLVPQIVVRLDNINPAQLKSYNKVRKPIDIYIEHIVAMGEEFTEKKRKCLIQKLFVPLDSELFKCEELFTDVDLRLHGLSRRSTYSHVVEKDTYDKLQQLLEKKTRKIGKSFYPIYFDLVWRNRHTRKKAGNLFQSNPKIEQGDGSDVDR